MTDTTSEEKPKGLGPTALRFASAIPLIGVAIWLIFFGPGWAFQAFGLLWIGIVAFELMRMAMPDAPLGRAWGTLATVGIAAVEIFAGGVPGSMLLTLFGLAVGAMVFGLAEPRPVEDAARRVGWLMGGPVYVGGTLGTIALLHSHDHGGAWVLLAMFFAFLSDTGAYFAGRAFGKHKLYPLVSPKKTVEGSIGGLITAAAGGAALQQTLLAGTLPLVDVLILGVVAAALGQAGDLLESLIKRSTKVKDSGNIMPGHGGLLDRSDALMFTAAAVWVYVSFILPMR